MNKMNNLLLTIVLTVVVGVIVGLGVVKCIEYVDAVTVANFKAH